MYPVVHVIDTLSVGGAQRLLTILATDSARACPAVLDLRGHSSTMADEIMAHGVLVQSAGIHRSLNPRDWWRVWRALRTLPSPLLHLHLTDSVIMAAPLGRLMKRKVVVTVHNTRTVPSGKLTARLKKRLENFALRHFTDHAILVGENVAKANAARLTGVPQSVLPNVIVAPKPVTPEARAKFRADAGIRPDEIVFIATGRLHAQKDHMTLLHSFERLLKSGAPAKLWILGDGQESERLRAEAVALNLGEACRFYGSRPDVDKFLGAADVFVMSSAWEGLPLGLLEGMAAGLPVVATAVGDLPSTLGESGGLLVPPGDLVALSYDMAKMAASADLRSDYGARSARIVAPYLDTQGWLDKTVAVYRSLVGVPPV